MSFSNDDLENDQLAKNNPNKQNENKKTKRKRTTEKPKFVKRKNIETKNDKKYFKRPRKLKKLRTIYINDIPQQKLNFADIISFFDKFGEITSVQINKQKSQVFVKYEKQNEAELAMKEAFPVFGDESIRLRWAFFEKQEMSVLENTQEYLFCISKCKERLKTIFGQLENCQKLTKLAKNALKSKNDFGRPENTKILTKLKTLKKSLRGKIENFCRNFPVLDKSNLTFETKPDFWIKIDNNCDLLFDLIAKKFGIEQLYKSDHSVFSVDLRPKILQISNLPKEYLNLNFIKGHFYVSIFQNLNLEIWIYYENRNKKWRNVH
ncbi:hypothetical protein MHBO_003701 [Bonamia ostreae]|uniref:RRM domain-containing protein n=1 Tax=Bonamia ostreae TaxID=126728 RepID=A0ABV2AR83_9EUKA